MIPVTKPFLPPLEHYQDEISEIFRRNWITNDGPVVRSLETRVRQKLGSNEMAFVTNGTVALQLAIRALQLQGEIITTPFSYVATTTSILWEGCTPIFVDIEPHGFNIDPETIEAAITEKTSAILATHCFGIPCDIDSIQDIARRHGLKVIFDGAHCFGTKYKGESVFNYGDVSTCSFHATKLFHTVEGGAVFANDENLIKAIRLLRNFGHDGPEKFSGIGINGKNSEVHAAMGLCVLPHMDDILGKRREINRAYFKQLQSLGNLKMVDPSLNGWNWAYCPVVFSTENLCLEVKAKLEEHDIHPRRYFYPSLESIHGEPGELCSRSDSLASRILCLPSFYDLTSEEIKRIAGLIREKCNP
jgi:dTDP-4-amino-4,6-dideoxygalactose transaminase